MRWVTFSNPREPDKAPEWMMTAGISDEGIIFVPARLFGSEGLIYNNAKAERIACTEHNGLKFVPARWIAELAPQHAEVLEIISRAVRYHFNNDGEAMH